MAVRRKYWFLKVLTNFISCIWQKGFETLSVCETAVNICCPYKPCTDISSPRTGDQIQYFCPGKKLAIFDLMLFAQFTSDSLSEEHNVGDVVTFKCLIIPKRFVENCLPAASLQFAKHALETCLEWSEFWFLKFVGLFVAQHLTKFL